MSLKSRLLKSRENKAFASLAENSELDLLSYFKEHSFEKIIVPQYDKIYAEKNGTVSMLPIAFSTKDAFFAEVEKIKRALDINSKDEKNILTAQNGVVVKLFLPPAVKNQPYLEIAKRTTLSFTDYFQNKLVSSEISAYLKECLEQNVNIFVLGDASVNKNQILNFMLDLSGEFNKNVIYDNSERLSSKKGCNIRISSYFLKHLPDLEYDNIFCADVKKEDLSEIFGAIISGYNGFNVSLSVKNDVDILAAVRNMILLSNTNLFEENAEFLTVSAIDVIIFAQNDADGNVCISKISELSKNNQNDIILRDIFVRNKKGTHVSTGNISKFYNAEMSKRFLKEYLEEDHIHSYVSGVSAQVLPAQKDEKKKRFKEKLKKLKEDKLLKNIENKEPNVQSEQAFVPVEDKLAVQEEQPEIIEPENIVQKEETETNAITDFTTDFQPASIDEEKEELVQEEKNDLNIENEVFASPSEEDDDIYANKGLLASESDDFSETPKIRNILEDYEDEELSEENVQENENLINEEIPTSENIDLPVEKEDIIAEKYSDYVVDNAENKEIEEPELFSEIKDVDIQGYETDFMEVPDEDI